MESRRTPGEIFRAFLLLGLSSFGGPIAHIGYFRREFVERRRWLSDRDFAELLALCQFLPGPASSQLGFGIGLTRAGPAGAVAAFLGFTLPSALLMFGFAALLPSLSSPLAAAAIEGLKIVALVVVAHGLLGMVRSLTPDLPRAAIALASLAVMLLTIAAWFQLIVIALGAAAGAVLLKRTPPLDGERMNPGYGAKAGAALIAVFVLLFLTLWLWAADGSPMARTADAFYRSGALVFGGGHVVLPLLEETVVAPGWVSDAQFLAGYGAAQAVPGPMFTLASYLGAFTGGGAAGAIVATLAVFLPGFLLLAGILPLWHTLSARPVASRIVAGVNASVVGLLAAALYDPVFVSVAGSLANLGIAAAAFAALLRWNVPALWIVAGVVAARVAASQFGL